MSHTIPSTRTIPPLKQLQKVFVPKLTKYIPHVPYPKQLAFLLTDQHKDVFYGGAAGGGKSDALLMAALQYVDVPGYSALIMRNSFSNLSKDDGLIPRSHDWLSQTDAKWSEQLKRWSFPSGAGLSFGYLDSPRDHHNYKSSAYHFIGIDEIVDIREFQARYMFSRLRKTTDINVPLRYRCASNPPSMDQIATGAWVKRRYVDPRTASGKVFVSARLEDNPSLDYESYVENLMELDPTTRKQLLEGDWEVQDDTGFFKPEWWWIVETAPTPIFIIRYWDLAGSNKDHSAYTAGVKLALCEDKRFYILHVERFKLTAGEVLPQIKATAEEDGENVVVGMNRDPGQAGIFQVSQYVDELKEFEVHAALESGAKPTRAGAAATQCKYQNLRMVDGPWNTALIDEGRLFPDSEYKDQIDSLSGAYKYLVNKARSSGIQFAVPTGKTVLEMQKDLAESKNKPPTSFSRNNKKPGAVKPVPSRVNTFFLAAPVLSK